MRKILITSLCFLTILTSNMFIGCTRYNSNKNLTGTSDTETRNLKSSNTQSVRNFSAADLMKYNGQNGNPAYIAVNGVIYDVTNAKGWKNGIYKTGLAAGRDLTNDFKKLTNGNDLLRSLPIIGNLKK